MGLWQALFGARPGAAPEHPEANKDQPQYGRLAERRDLAKDVRSRYWSVRRSPAPDTGAHAVARKPRIWGITKAAGRLAEQIERGGRRPPLEFSSSRSRWKALRSIGKIERSLGDAETPEELRGIAHTLRRPNPPGKYRRLVRKLHKSRDSYFKKLEAGGASSEDLRRAQSQYDWRIGRFEKRLGRRLLRPTSRIRL